MSNEKEGLDTEFASQSVEGISYKLPAIRIIERYGRKEIELEFATAEDYADYKRIETESLMTDKQKYDAAVKKACEAAIDENSKHSYWHAMCKQIKI